MSTAGKVLTVLILLVMVGWLAVMSAVTQYNVNWQQKLIKQENDIKGAEEGIAKAKAMIFDLTEKTRIKEADTDLELRALQGRIASAERRQSVTSHSLTLLKFELAEYLVAADKAKLNLANREGEKNNLIDVLAKKKDETGKAQAVNADLRDQLAKLQDEFKRLLAENAEQAAKMLKDRPTTKPASDRRIPPAS